MPEDLDTNFEETPSELPVVIRANYMIENNNVRPVMVVNMPIIYRNETSSESS